MKTAAGILLGLGMAFCLSQVEVRAQTGPNALGCFTKAEMAAERLVREGLRLREGALGCDGPPWNKRTKPLWQDIDTKFGQRFQVQTRARAKAFQREFADDAEDHLQLWDGRTVMFFRHYPLSDDYCDAIKETLQDVQKKGWNVVNGRAGKGRIPVEMDYRACDR